MVRWWKIKFHLVLTMTVGVLLRLGVPLRKIGFVKKNKKMTFWKSKSLSELTKKSYRRHATFVSLDKHLSFQKGHFLFFFTKDFAISSLFLFCVFVCPSHFVHGLFAPISQSPMSKLFRYSESLGKSNWKKWSQIWTFFLKNGVKMPRQKKFFFFLRIFVICSLRLKVFFPHFRKFYVQFHLDIWNRWGKVMERSGLRL